MVSILNSLEKASGARFVSEMHLQPHSKDLGMQITHLLCLPMGLRGLACKRPAHIAYIILLLQEGVTYLKHLPFVWRQPRNGVASVSSAASAFVGVILGIQAHFKSVPYLTSRDMNNLTSPIDSQMGLACFWILTPHSCIWLGVRL